MKNFEKYHPIVLFSYFMVVIGMAMFFMHPVYLFLTFIAAMTLNYLLQRRHFWKNLFMYIPLFFIMAIINPLISHNGQRVILYVNGNAITVEAICYGMAMALMIIAVIIWFNSYNDVMTSDKFLYLFGKLSPTLALTISITMRLIPRFKHQIHLIAQAQKTIGMDYTAGNPWQRIKSVIRIMSILITWALENAIETADSMKARGYGLPGRATFSLFVFEKRDGWMLGIIALLAGLSVVGSLLGNTTFYFYPTFSDIYWTVESVSFYSGYAILLAIPIAIEIKEGIKWRYLKSTI
ncbi:MAG: energy-coupling factor transporter transmembrane component T [Lysinibacillus sp.]